ncbi:MAG TPA: RodZ domain-containing protein [Acidiferrobacterales bacterium]|nr:RodZ domain-containing protein [Acidiferrobacterales bacterium]
MTTAHPDTAVRAPIHGPGALLAQARADLHLAHEEVAAKLHLATRQIQALEQDDYSSLPGATYVRGYLKSYALLLGLSPEPILEAHARLTAAPVTPDFRAIAPQREITSRHHQVRFVTYFMAAIVIGLAIAWWQGRDVRPSNPLLAERDSELAVAAPDTVPGADAIAESEKLPAEKPATPAPAGIAVTGSKPAAPVTPSGPTAASTPAVAPQPAGAVPAPAAQPAGPRIKLVLHADQDSWADIRDARQTRLLYDTVLAGRSVTLEGVAPVSIFLGNAAGVRLDYNGQAVDVARYKRGMMARFTLGEEEAAVVPAR